MNGFLTFSKLSKQLLPNPGINLPEDTAFLAPFMSDIDTSIGASSGALYINSYTAGDVVTMGTQVIDKIKKDLQEHQGVSGFQPTYVLVATWENVSPFPASLYGTMEVCTVKASI